MAAVGVHRNQQCHGTAVQQAMTELCNLVTGGGGIFYKEQWSSISIDASTVCNDSGQWFQQTTTKLKVLTISQLQIVAGGAWDSAVSGESML